MGSTGVATSGATPVELSVSSPRSRARLMRQRRLKTPQSLAELVGASGTMAVSTPMGVCSPPMLIKAGLELPSPVACRLAGRLSRWALRRDHAARSASCAACPPSRGRQPNHQTIAPSAGALCSMRWLRRTGISQAAVFTAFHRSFTVHAAAPTRLLKMFANVLHFDSMVLTGLTNPRLLARRRSGDTSVRCSRGLCPACPVPSLWPAASTSPAVDTAFEIKCSRQGPARRCAWRTTSTVATADLGGAGGVRSTESRGAQPDARGIVADNMCRDRRPACGPLAAPTKCSASPTPGGLISRSRLAVPQARNLSMPHRHADRAPPA